MDYSLRFIDNTHSLPNEIFGQKKEVACSFFISDSKVNFARLREGESHAIATCEFGLGSLSNWKVKEWEEEGGSRPINRMVEALNRKNRLWLMAKSEVIDQLKKKEIGSFIQYFEHALKQSSQRNTIGIEKVEVLEKFPTPYNQEDFKAHNISTYYAVGYTPYHNLSSEFFGNITGEYPNDPRILMLDGGLCGPVNRIFGYKFLSRLAMNGTEAAGQNPPYLLTESIYRPELAALLKEKFPNEDKIVLKHVAASKGAGIVVVNATTVETLDKALNELLTEGSAFKKVSPLSICLFEKFFSTPEKSRKDETKWVETMTRIVYLYVKNKGKWQLRVIDGAKAHEDPAGNTQGLVKLGKWNDGKIEVLSDGDLQLIENRIGDQIKVIARRAMQYDSQAAVKYFLTSDHPILNLVGVELFCPTHLCSYRERTKENKLRISDAQCELFSALLDRNQSPLLLQRLFSNSLFDISNLIGESVLVAPKFPLLFEKMLDLGEERGIQEQLAQELTSILSIDLNHMINAAYHLVTWLSKRTS